MFFASRPSPIRKIHRSWSRTRRFPGRMSHRLVANSLKNVRKRTYFISPLPNSHYGNDFLNPHWRSEVLVPTIDSESKKVTTFNRATSLSERSIYGGQFLNTNPQALIHAANAVVRRYGYGIGGSRGTAFQVGNGSWHHEFGNGVDVSLLDS